MRIVVKYCGGCNPEIDRVRVVEEVRSWAAERGVPVEYAAGEEAPATGDLLLVVSGCGVDCATRPPGYEDMVVVVAGRSLEGELVPEEELGRRLTAVLGQKLDAPPGKSSSRWLPGLCGGWDLQGFA